jgi:hypothetical protein
MNRSTATDMASWILIGAAMSLAPVIAAGSDSSTASPAIPPAPSTTYIAAKEVTTALAHLSPIYTDDEPVRVVNAGAYNVGLFVVGRPKRNTPIADDGGGALHVTEGLQLDHVTVILNVLKGTGTLVTGGTLDDGKRMAANDPDLPVIGPGSRGKVIRGGSGRAVSVGDIIIIPAGVVHGFSDVKEPLAYSAIRIDSAKVLPLN